MTQYVPNSKTLLVTRGRLANLLGMSFYELDRLDLSASTTLNAELQEIGIALAEYRALVLVQARATGGIGQSRVFDDVLVDRLDQRIDGYGLHEDRAVVVLRRVGYVDLQ